MNKTEAYLFNVMCLCPACNSIIAIDNPNKIMYCSNSSCDQYEWTKQAQEESERNQEKQGL